MGQSSGLAWDTDRLDLDVDGGLGSGAGERLEEFFASHGSQSFHRVRVFVVCGLLTCEKKESSDCFLFVSILATKESSMEFVFFFCFF